MKKIILSFRFTIVLAAFCVVLSNCDCHNDCPLPLTIHLEVTNSSGRNLFAQPNPALSFDSVTVISVYDNFTHHVTAGLAERNDRTVITFSSTGGIRELIIKYSSRESDTLEFSNFVYNKGECCQTIGRYDLRLNHQIYCTSCGDEIITIVR